MKDQKHNYEYEVETTSNTAPANVIRMVGKNKNVLEVGCGPGSITRVLSQQAGCKMTCLELDLEAIKIVAPHCDDVFQVDLNSTDWINVLENSKQFDVVVAADVLEHLYDPWKTLEMMKSLVNSNGYIVISLPHIGHASVISCLINGDFKYGDWGLLDRTHIRFFGLDNMEALFAKAGLKIVEATFVTKSPAETEFSAEWNKISKSLQAELMKCKYSEIYQVVIKAVPFSYEGVAVELVPPVIEYNDNIISSTLIRLKTILRNHLPYSVKRDIKKIIRLLGINLR